MIDRLLFHIGDPKNGSSSIQKALKQRAWHCDSVSLAPQKALNASGLANALRDDDRSQRKSREWPDLAAWVHEKDADLGVISAEFFAKVKPANLQAALDRHLPDQAGTARVLAYVRPHAAWIVSAFGTRVKTGGFDGTLADFAAQVSQTPFLHYTPRFSRWEQVFGPRFTLRPFLRPELHQGDVAADFFRHAFEGAAFTLAEVAEANVSLSAEEVAAMQVVQAELNRQGVEKPMRLAIGGALGREMDGIAERTKGQRLQLDRSSALALRERLREDAQALDAQFFGRPLMAPALEEAPGQAIDRPQPSAVEAYYAPAAIAEIRALTAELAPRLLAGGRQWRNAYRRDKNPDHARHGHLAGPKKQADIDQIRRLMTQLAQAIAVRREPVAENL